MKKEEMYNGVLANVKPVKITGKKIKFYKGGTLVIPKGTKVSVFVNIDNKDPSSDVYPCDLILLKDCMVRVTDGVGFGDKI